MESRIKTTGLLLFLLATGWLILPAGRSDGTPAVGALMVHGIGGALLAAPLLRWCAGRRRESRDGGARRAWGMGSLLVAACIAGAAGMVGRALMGYAADRPGWLFWMHGGPGGAAVVLIGALLVREAARRQRVGSVRGRRAGYAAAAVIAGVVAVSLATGLRSASRFAAYDPEAYYQSLTATNERQADNPLFPSALRVSGPDGARDEECRHCHLREVAQWQGSAHAHAGDDKGYRRSLAALVERRGREAVRWCQGCHAPERLVRGRDGSGESDHSVGEPGRPDPHSGGVTCVSCHAVRTVPLLTGNGGLVRDTFSAAASPDVGPDPLQAEASVLTHFLTYLRPGPHRAAMSRATAAARRADLAGDPASRLCSGCHRVGFTVAQNGYHFMRGPDEFGTWQESAIAGYSIHGFRAPGTARSCLSCHMPRYYRHRFTTVSAEPAVTLDLFARRVGQGAGENEWAVPLEQHATFLRPGGSTVVDVVVANHGVGHAFPGGFTDIRDIWVQITVTDASARTILAHGVPDTQGRLAPDAHGLGLLPLDRQGRLLRHNELERWVASAREAADIGPGEAHVAHYRLDLPAAERWPLTLRARLNEHRYTPEFAAFAGTPRPSDRDVRVLAKETVQLTLPMAARQRRRNVAKEAVRWYDYGVGLLLQEDLPRAARAMLRTQRFAGVGVDPWLGLGRVYLREGDLLAARSQFEEAGRRAPGDPRPGAFMGTLYRRMGEYDQALKLLLPLARAYPADRATYFDIGLSYLRTGRPAEAAAAFTRMLELDPDDVSAHYNLWMCYQRLRRYADARLEEAIYRSLRPGDGASPALARYLRAHPPAAVEARVIHEHRLRSVGG